MHYTKKPQKTKIIKKIQQDYTVIHFLYFSDVNFDHGVVSLQMFGLPKTQNTPSTRTQHSAA